MRVVVARRPVSAAQLPSCFCTLRQLASALLYPYGWRTSSQGSCTCSPSGSRTGTPWSRPVCTAPHRVGRTRGPEPGHPSVPGRAVSVGQERGTASLSPSPNLASPSLLLLVSKVRVDEHGTCTAIFGAVGLAH